MVRDAGFESGDPAFKIKASSAMTHAQTHEMAEIMTLWGRLTPPIRASIMILIRAQAKQAF
jgi:hypothetical protein